MLAPFLAVRDVGTLQTLQGISAGVTNTNYFVTTTQGRYVLTLFETLRAGDLPFYVDLMSHLAIKLAFNTLSTGTMVGLKRVKVNWMSWVEVSNKKLRDRGIRLIAELCGISYRDACYALHETLVEMEQMDFSGKAKPSPVQRTIKRLMSK